MGSSSLLKNKWSAGKGVSDNNYIHSPNQKVSNDIKVKPERRSRFDVVPPKESSPIRGGRSRFDSKGTPVEHRSRFDQKYADVAPACYNNQYDQNQ